MSAAVLLNTESHNGLLEPYTASPQASLASVTAGAAGVLSILPTLPMVGSTIAIGQQQSQNEPAKHQVRRPLSKHELAAMDPDPNQKLHGKPRPFFKARDGTIKIHRTLAEHAPCTVCGTTKTPVWKKGLNNELVCLSCNLIAKHTAIKRRTTNSAKIAAGAGITATTATSASLDFELSQSSSDSSLSSNTDSNSSSDVSLAPLQTLLARSSLTSGPGRRRAVEDLGTSTARPSANRHGRHNAGPSAEIKASANIDSGNGDMQNGASDAAAGATALRGRSSHSRKRKAPTSSEQTTLDATGDARPIYAPNAAAYAMVMRGPEFGGLGYMAGYSSAGWDRERQQELQRQKGLQRQQEQQQLQNQSHRSLSSDAHMGYMPTHNSSCSGPSSDSSAGYHWDPQDQKCYSLPPPPPPPSQQQQTHSPMHLHSHTYSRSQPPGNEYHYLYTCSPEYRYQNGQQEYPEYPEYSEYPYFYESHKYEQPHGSSSSWHEHQMLGLEAASGTQTQLDPVCYHTTHNDSYSSAYLSPDLVSDGSQLLAPAQVSRVEVFTSATTSASSATSAIPIVEAPSPHLSACSEEHAQRGDQGQESLSHEEDQEPESVQGDGDHAPAATGLGREQVMSVVLNAPQQNSRRSPVYMASFSSVLSPSHGHVVSSPSCTQDEGLKETEVDELREDTEERDEKEEKRALSTPSVSMGSNLSPAGELDSEEEH
ncbi:hypothetical protein BGZ58_005511 [Dissophora ornata]|nr:hypothetical protein BGZ58_005511 [Dissophora ornata]